MKSFKDIVKETVNPPRSEDEQRFVAKHVVSKREHPVATDAQFADKRKKDKSRDADHQPGEDEEVYEQVDLKEKAKSEAQQKAAAIALAVKRGKMPKSALQGASKEMYKMSEKDLEDYAKTKHAGIPERVEESYAIYHKGSVFDTFNSKEEAEDAIAGMGLSPSEKKDYKIRKTAGSSKPKMTGRMMKEDPFEEVPMMIGQLEFIEYAADEIMDYLEMGVDPEEWFQNKVSAVHNQMQSLYSFVEGEKRMMNDEDEDDDYDDLDEAVSVKKNNYSWGKMITVHHGASHSFPLHPEHQEKIRKLESGEKVSFKDETGKIVTASRDGDTIHLKQPGSNKKTSVARSHFTEEVNIDEASINELTRDTLASYHKKAMTQVAPVAMKKSKADKQLTSRMRSGKSLAGYKPKDELSPEEKKLYQKRMQGGSRAMQRISSIDKLSSTTNHSYKGGSEVRKIKEELDEAVEVSHDRYMRSHGKKASGTGGWFFTHKSGAVNNLDDPKEVHFKQGKFSDAKKSAQQWAKKHGHSTVYVMEEVKLDEGILKSFHTIAKKPWSQTVKDSKGTAGEYSQIAKGKDFTVWTGYGGSLKKQVHYVVRDDKIIGSGWTMNSALKDAGLKDSDLTARSKFAPGSILNKGMKEEILDEAVKSGSLKLKDGSTIRVSSDESEAINSLFSQLNTANKKKMEERMMESKKGFEEILKFAKEAL